MTTASQSSSTAKAKLKRKHSSTSQASQEINRRKQKKKSETPEPVLLSPDSERDSITAKESLSCGVTPAQETSAGMSSDEEYGSDQIMSDDEMDVDSLGELGMPPFLSSFL